MLLFTRDEMVKFTEACVTKKTGKRSSFFSFGFNEPHKLYHVVSHDKKPNVSEKLLKNCSNQLRQGLGLPP